MKNKILKRNACRLAVSAICAAALLWSSTASALIVSAEFNLANSTIANSVIVHDANTIEVSLTPGDILTIDIVVSNAPADFITSIFTSLVVDSSQLAYLGGSYSNILMEETCTGFLCTPVSLSAFAASPPSKPNDPLSLGTGTANWIQAVGHGTAPGSAGLGPDVAARIGFEYIGLSGADFVQFESLLTAGDGVEGVVGPINFLSASIVIPEPGTALLLGLGLGLLGLGTARRREA